ncbi:hypothetical protein ITP53_12445 [Nonomuraea sp. K274]|uniref:Secreted protein n=1 Tax=Nonomuraea cypriaca TaxID=1187855 RepID=A0A931A574_9ACTN|nr:hypothetical protein [Nonomuraea cypriaca]MBF8186536.1 hypothetical protein [Nonomuraea cypriaca]
MLKKIATGVLALAATSALALSLPSAAGATASGFHDSSVRAGSPAYQDSSDGFGPVYSRNHLARAQGLVSVDWDRDGESNEVTVRGRLYDLDNRGYSRGGKCAYVIFQAADFDHDWSPVESKKHCGYPGYRRIAFNEHDISSLRVKVCQVGPYGGYPTKCGQWRYIDTSENA